VCCTGVVRLSRFHWQLSIVHTHICGVDTNRNILLCDVPETRIETFLESCGVADLVTTCYSGRNRKVAEAFATAKGKVLQRLLHSVINSISHTFP